MKKLLIAFKKEVKRIMLDIYKYEYRRMTARDEIDWCAGPMAGAMREFYHMNELN